MKKLDITFHFIVNEDDPYAYASYEELARFMLDEAWDVISDAGLIHDGYDIEEDVE